MRQCDQKLSFTEAFFWGGIFPFKLRVEDGIKDGAVKSSSLHNKQVFQCIYNYCLRNSSLITAHCCFEKTVFFYEVYERKK
jgi:hypothetical protein